MELVFGLILGMSLSAACGFRIFVPPLVINLATRSGQLTLLPEAHWMTSDLALVVFAAAAVLEVAAYYIPWLDNALDTVATPVAIVAGVVVMESFVGELSPLLGWTIAAILGGSAAGATQVVTDVTRLASTATTGGLANPVVSTMELGSSVTLSLLAILAPFVSIVVVLFLMGWGLQKTVNLVKRRERKRKQH